MVQSAQRTPRAGEEIHLSARTRVLGPRLGCGPGDPATRILAERHYVVGADLSWEQLQIARQHTRAPLVHADMTTLAFRPQSLEENDGGATFLWMTATRDSGRPKLMASTLS